MNNSVQRTRPDLLHLVAVILEREEDGGFHAFSSALPGCHSQWESLEETLSNIREEILASLESLKAHNELLPREDLLIKPVEVAL